MYRSCKKLLKTSCLGDILTTHGFLVVEHAATDEIDLGSGVAAFELYKQANYGKIAVTFLMKR